MARETLPDQKPVAWLCMVVDVYKMPDGLSSKFSGKTIASCHLVRGVIQDRETRVVIYRTNSKLQVTKDMAVAFERYCISGWNYAPATGVGILLDASDTDSLERGDLIWADC